MSSVIAITMFSGRIPVFWNVGCAFLGGDDYNAQLRGVFNEGAVPRFSVSYRILLQSGAKLQVSSPSKQMNEERYFSPDDGDDGFSSPLNEADWGSYLAAIDAEVGRFLKLFIESRHVSNHMDMIFAAMKWEKIVFTCDDSPDDDIEVMTFHKNPANIAARAIFFFLEKILDIFMSDGRESMSTVCWQLSKFVGTMRDEMLNGIASVDSCEYVLGICHFKRVIAAVNGAIHAIGKIQRSDERAAQFVNDFAVAVFDIRELAWQSIVLCNAAEQRYDDGPNFS
ncbi:MAG: hypothetical protein LBR91_02265 [Puniceicoccales bacterium]|nr:hypothetical protein [Puniceicoccales bacterium]